MSKNMWHSGEAAQQDVDVVDKGAAKMPKFDEHRMMRPGPLSELNGNHSRCICERPLTPLLCTNCMKTYFGRIGRTCTEHPNVLYLQDLKSCFNCGMKMLIEIDEATLSNMNQMKR